jgi:hypothetical protein
MLNQAGSYPWTGGRYAAAESLYESSALSIDRSRVPLDLKTIKTILGYQRRPRYHRRKSKSIQWEVAVEKPTFSGYFRLEPVG